MWTDYKILQFYNSKINSTNKNGTLRTIDDMTPEEIRRKRITINNPYILEQIWKPNLFFGMMARILKYFMKGRRTRSTSRWPFIKRV